MFAVLAGHFALDEDWDSAAHAFALAIAVWTVTRDLERAHQMLQRAIAVCDQGASVDAQLTVANAAASMHPEQAVRLVMAALDVPEGTPVQPVESWLTPARRRLLLSPSLRGVHLVLGWYATGLASVDDDLDAPPEESWARVVGLALERLGFVASAAAGYQEAADEAYAQGALDRAARFYDWHNRLWSPDHAEHWGDHYHYALQGAEAVEQYRVALEHAEHDFDRYRLFTKIVDASMLGERDQVWLDQAITWIAEGAKALPSTEARAVADLLAPLDSEAALGVYQASLGQAHLPLHPINAWIADRAQLGADGLSALARAIAHHWSWDDLPLLSPESRAAVDAA
jgi:hypothetical protein